MNKPELTNIPSIQTGYRLQHEEAQESWVLLYPEGMVKLNDSAAEILKRCDGERDIHKIVAVLEEDFQETGLQDDVLSFMQIALEQKWVTLANG